MATPTSSSNRSKRKATKPVTTDKGRNNRAKVSTAKTTSNDTRSTNSSARITNASQRVSSGSAKVTGTSKPALPARSSASDLQRLQTASKTKPTRPAPRSIPKPQGKPALPPGQKGGALVPTGTRQSRAEAKAKAAAQGSTGPNRIGRSDARPALPQGRQGGPLAKGTQGGAMTRAAGAAGKAASTAARLGGRMLGAFGTALAIPSAIKNIADVAERNRQWDAYKERMGMNKPTPTTKPSSTTAGRRTGTNNRTANLSIPTSSAGTRAGAAAGTRTRSRTTTQPTAGTDWRSRVSNSDVNALRQGQNDAIRSYGNTPAAPKPAKPPAPTQSGGGSTQSRGSSSAPAAPRRQPGPAADAGMKNQNKDYRGNLFEKTFGYKPGKAPDQQKARFKSVDNKFGQDSGYESQTKVDGSKYADKKPDMKKVKEYDRLRRKYYD